MAHVDDNSGGRQVAIEPNIVPFIDLMSVLIIFLLISAVWTQVSMIQIGSSVYGKKQNDETVQTPPQFEVAFRLDVLANGYNVVIGTDRFFVQKENGEYNDDQLVERLNQIKQRYPQKEDVIITVLDDLPYSALIKGMDALLVSGFPLISVATQGVE